jgi:ankyrin repeat protein
MGRPLLALLAAVPELFSAIHAQDVSRVAQLLEKNPALASAHDEKGGSAVSAALAVPSGEAFLPRADNKVLDLILARHPNLSDFETCAAGSAHDVALLLEKDPGLLTRTSDLGWTPLHYAAFEDNADAAELLLEAGAAVDARARNKFDNTPIQVAMLTQSVRVTRVLLAHGASVVAVTAEGVTALHEAAQGGNAELVRLLLDAGASPSTPSDFGTPLELAEHNKHSEALRLLRERANGR